MYTEFFVLFLQLFGRFETITGFCKNTYKKEDAGPKVTQT